MADQLVLFFNRMKNNEAKCHNAHSQRKKKVDLTKLDFIFQCQHKKLSCHHHFLLFLRGCGGEWRENWAKYNDLFLEK